MTQDLAMTSPVDLDIMAANIRRVQEHLAKFRRN
jgi:ribosomal protein S15P/S13E